MSRAATWVDLDIRNEYEQAMHLGVGERLWARNERGPDNLIVRTIAATVGVGNRLTLHITFKEGRTAQYDYAGQYLIRWEDRREVPDG